MQDAGYELRRINLPRTSVNRREGPERVAPVPFDGDIGVSLDDLPAKVCLRLVPSLLADQTSHLSAP
jgi:hypothetical protein